MHLNKYKNISTTECVVFVYTHPTDRSRSIKPTWLEREKKKKYYGLYNGRCQYITRYIHLKKKKTILLYKRKLELLQYFFPEIARILYLY